MKILFFGCVESSKILLETLIENNFNVVGVLTKKESNFNSDFVDLASYCIKKCIDYNYTEDINDNTSIEHIKSKNPDIIYCFGWSQIIKREVINIPKYGVVGFHPTSLPQNRGRHPIIWSLVLGLNKTSSTFFFMDEGADTGDIISQKDISIEYSDDARTLYDKILRKSKEQVIEITKEIESNSIIRLKQNNKNANYWRKRTKLDGKIDWRMSSESIYNLVRALTKLCIGAYFEYQNREIKIWKVEEVKLNGFENIEYGKIIEIYSNNSFLIKVRDNLIKVLVCDEIKLKVGEYI